MDSLKYPRLFTPITLGNVTFRNRIFGAPTGWSDYGDDSRHPPAAAAYYGRKARGGAASVAVGELLVDDRHGRGGEHHARMDTPKSTGSLNDLTDAITRWGAVAVAELQHAGMYAREAQNRGGEIYGPVALDEVHGDIALKDGAASRVLAMTEEIIEFTVEAYGNAALFAKKCGFGMVMLHGGHGWLLSQFLSPTLNIRDDRWGGSLENRVRFPLAIVQRIREKCGKDFPIEFRMSVTEANPKGYGVDEGVKIAMAMDGKVDLIHASAGHHEVRDAFVVTHPSLFLEDGCNAYLARELKKHVTTPVATVGAFTEPELMEEILASGGADVIEVARELFADPDMPRKSREGRGEDVTRCLRCLTCFSNLMNTRHFCCAVNPEIGAELAVQSLPAVKTRKTVLVAGGGVAGMQAALTARERGHDVVLYEKSERLGGVLRCEENVPFKDKLTAYLDLQTRRLEKSGVKIKLNEEVTPELIKSLSPDAVIAALGAQPVRPRINGIDAPNVFSAEDVYVRPELAGDKVAVLGGGLVGVELAVFLAGLGKSVTIIEMLPELSDGGNQLHMLALDVEIRARGVNVLLSAKAEEITEKSVAVRTQNGLLTLDTDAVVYAVGQSPKRDIANALGNLVPEFYAVGDCVSPRNIREATRSGYFAAVNLGIV